MGLKRARGWNRRWAATLLALLLVAWPNRGAADPDPSPAEALSAAFNSLRSDLEAILRGATGSWRLSRWSVLAVSLDRGDTLYAENPGEALAPASNLKLITSATAIQRLGAGFRYQTFLLSSGRVSGGRLEGDLVLYGTGDPGLSDRFTPGGLAVFEAFADSLLLAGIHQIAGDVVGDGSYFAGPLLGEGWNPNDLNDAFAAPSAALSFNENVFQLRVRPSQGDVPEISTLPEGAGVPVLNTARVGAAQPLLIRRSQPTEPISVAGAIPGTREVWRQLTVPDPAHFSASVLKNVLEKRGIQVAGAARAAYVPSESPVTGKRLWASGADGGGSLRVVARHTSPPLLDYLVVVNKRSHNLLADQVLKTVGRIDQGDGSYEGGARALLRFLADSVGIDESAVRIYDGSGLSALNRTSAADFVALMSYMAERGDWNAFWETLPEAGNPRELRRMYQTPAAGNLRAKTGTIQNVSALSGMVRSTGGERIAFSIIVNGAPSTSRAKGIEDRIGSRLAAFERPFDVEVDVTVAAATLEAGTAEAASAAGAQSDPASPPPPPPGAEGGAPSGAGPDASASETQGDAGRQHRVRAGESFSTIARLYGVPVDALVKANLELSPRRLQPGSWVRIP